MTAFYGDFGGAFVPDAAKEALNELERAFVKFSRDAAFNAELKILLRDYVGRPSPLYFARRLSEFYGREIYLKREDLNHTGAHKINNALAQALLAKKMGKKRLIAETGAGQHGLAVASVAALLGLECEIFMGQVDLSRQALNVYKMELLGAKVHAVGGPEGALTAAVDEAIAVWLGNLGEAFYLLGSAVGPHPYPKMVAHFQSVIGRECKAQLRRLGKRPELIIAAAGGGSNAAGIFLPFLRDEGVRLIGVEAGGLGLDTPHHAATLSLGRPAVIHGMRTLALLDEDGRPAPVHSISAGLDYPGIGPLHAYLKSTGRAEYFAVSDEEALAAARLLCRLEGILPALESAHALAYLERLDRAKGGLILLNLSGRGDKDVESLKGQAGK